MSSTADARRIVNVLTGFLGSGKTTLLRRLLGSEAFSNCAVLVNELGEIPLDHELLEQIDQETVVLRSGCICCGVRSDMAEALSTLNQRRDRGEIPAFDRVVIETTGLADPVPVINTVSSDSMLKHHFRVGTVVSTVDAILGVQQLRQNSESFKQAAVADRLVITKADLASADSLAALRAELASVNPHASIVVSRNDATEAEVTMAADMGSRDRKVEAGQWFYKKPGGFATPSLFNANSAKHGRLSPVHDSKIRSCSLVFEHALDWTAFGIWLSMLLHRHGAAILRTKGILNLKDVQGPTVVHGVQHLLHPPVHLSRWPTEDHRSRLILIGDLPPETELRQSLERFNAFQ